MSDEDKRHTYEGPGVAPARVRSTQDTQEADQLGYLQDKIALDQEQLRNTTDLAKQKKLGEGIARNQERIKALKRSRF